MITFLTLRLVSDRKLVGGSGYTCLNVWELNLKIKVSGKKHRHFFLNSFQIWIKLDI